MVLIELSCLVILLVAAVLRRREAGWTEWLRDAPLVAAAALVGEDSCVRLYGFYAYSPQWHVVIDRVPVLVPIIWIFVVLSARDVAGALGIGRRWLPLAVGLLVWYDASFIEPSATFAGLWSWSRPGPFGVPLIGTLGWGLFALCAVLCLERLRGGWRLATVVVAPAATHLLLLVAWWGLFRWLPPVGDGAGLAAAFAVGGGLCAAAVVARRAASIPLRSLLARIPPAIFFLTLLGVRSAPLALWGYAASFVPPWLVLIRWRANPSRAPKSLSGVAGAPVDGP